MINVVSSHQILNLKPEIVLSHQGMEAVKHIVRIAPQEAQWFHTINVQKSNDKVYLFLSDKIYIPKQNTSAAQVDSTSTMMIEFYNELKQEYDDQNKINEILNSMTCWCHSHHNMAPNPSGQDVTQFNSFVKSSIDQNQNNWQVMLIFNKKDQFYSRVYDPTTGLIWEGVKINSYHNYDFSYIDQASKTKFLVPKVKPLPKVTSSTSGWFDFNKKPPYIQSPSLEDLETLNTSVAKDLLTEIYGPTTSQFVLSDFSNSEQIMTNIYGCLDEREITYLSLIVSGNHQKIKNYFSDTKLTQYLDRYESTVHNRIVKFISSSNKTSEDFLHYLSLTCSIADLSSSRELPKLFDYYGM